MYYIYEHVLKIDGRKYIGITCQKPEERWRNGSGYKGSTHFKHAIDKYGWDAFEHNILETCNTKKEAFALEEYYIALYNTTNETKGFNLQSGGESPKQHWTSVKKTGAAHKGKKYSGQALENIREAARRRDNSVFAHPRSEETKRKISKAHKGMTYSEETKQKLREAFSVPVLCVELNKTYPSMTIAAEEFGLSKCTISAVIKGRNKTAAGYHWQLA